MPSARVRFSADRFSLRRLSTLLLFVVLGVASAASPAHAQNKRADDAIYVRVAGGVSDYTGDLPVGTLTRFADFREFSEGTGAPLILSGELGYQIVLQFSLALGVQQGNHPLLGLNKAVVSDSRLVTGQFLARYTFGAEAWAVAPYLDGGAAVTAGGNPGTTGVGPTVGGGVDVKVSSSTSIYVESRFNLVVPDDAVDGADPNPPSFDVVGQLIGVGVKVNLFGAPDLPSISMPEMGGPTRPVIRSLEAPGEVRVRTPATFVAAVDARGADPPVSYQWEFGDGGTASGRRVTHTYSEPGTYAVTFTASMEGGTTSRSTSVTVTQRGMPPRILAVDGPTDVLTDDSVTFTAHIDGDGDPPPAYRWDFGDGGTGTGLTASHTFDFGGTYDVTFTASSVAGTARDTLTVTVARERPHPARIASIQARPNPAAEGALVHFRSAVQGARPLTYEWTFGDGLTAKGPSPTHTYEEPGRYTVRLEVSNELGTDSETMTIRVTASSGR